MKNNLRSLIFLLGFGVLLTACEGSFDSLVEDRLAENPLPTAPTYSKGSADFSTYVAIGNSLSAGYMDAALYDLGQNHSVPALLAKQFAAAGGGAFNQPSINSVNGFNTSVTQPGGVILGRFKLDTSIPGPSPVVTGSAITAYTGNKSTLNNFSVPGMRLDQIDSPALASNGFYARFASAPGTSTVLAEVVARKPSFFTFWLGNNDVLQYASTGGTNDALLTSPAVFQEKFTAAMGALVTQSTAKGVVADIPLISAAPFFRAVGWNAIPLDAATAGALNTQFGALNLLLGAAAQAGYITADEMNLRKLQYAAGQNAILSVDDNLTDMGPFLDQMLAIGQITAAQRAQLEPYRQARQLIGNHPVVGSELVLLGAGAVLGTPVIPGNAQIIYGVSYPISDALTLTADEIIKMETARQTNNAIIKAVVEGTNALAGSKRIALWETNNPSGIFYDLFGLSDGVLGVRVDGVNLAPDFSPNGVFSTDGVHPNIRGNAIIANQMLGLIEAEFGAKLPRVDVLSLPSVQLCAGDCASQR